MTGEESTLAWLHFSKDEINALPLIRYEGIVCVVDSSLLLKEAAEALRTEEILGFDTETKPCFRKGVSNLPSILQLAGSETVYVFQLQRLGGVRALLELLEASNIIKAGVSVDRDVKDLQALSPFEPARFVDLAQFSTQVGIKNNGLRGLAACLLGGRISKSAKTSDWSRERLTESQVLYAATDAWVSREIFLRLNEIRARSTSSTP